MLTNLHKRQTGIRGFTLIELMVAVVIVGILMAIAAPEFRKWLMNMQIHSVAQSMQAGLQRAKAEAIQRNRNVAFVLLPDQTKWEVLNESDLKVLDQNTDKAQVKNVFRKVMPDGATRVAFDFMGQALVQDPVDGSPAITSITLDMDPTVLSPADSKELIVTISFPSGQVKMCDPNAPTGSTRAC